MNAGADARFSRVRFGSFEADLSEGKLFKRGLLVRLENRPFQVLVALLEQPGQLVTREALQARLWPDGIHVDFDEGLNTAVKKLRFALGDSAETPVFIDTVPRRGYVFLAPVAAILPSTPELPAGQTQDASSENLPHLRGSAPGEDRPVRVRISKTTVAVGLGVLAIALSLTLLLVWQHRPRAAAKEPEFVRLSFGRGSITSARFAPDGQSVIYGAAWDGKPYRLFLARAGSPDVLPLNVEADILAISRSGEMAVLLRRRFGFGVSTKGTLALMSLTGSSPHEILDEVSYADWSPDGSKLAVIHYIGDICQLEYPLGHVLYRTSGGAWLSALRISPDGRRLAFLEHPLENDDDGHVASLEIGGEKKVLSKDFYGINGLAWEPQGREVFFGAGEPDQGGGRALFKVGMKGDAVLVRRETAHMTIEDVGHDGTLLLTRDVRGDEVLGHFAPNGKDVPLGFLSICLPTALSRDGSRLLLSVQGELTGAGYKVYLKSTSTADSPTLLGEGMPTALSPDGKSLVAIYPWGIRPSAIPQLQVMPLGSGELRQVTNDSTSHTWAGWMPDGKSLIFTGAEPGHNSRTWIQSVEGGKAVAITPEGTLGTVVSPDGATLAAIDGDRKLWLYPIKTGSARVLLSVHEVEEIDRWSDDGKYLYLTKYGMPAEVYQVDARTGTRKLLHSPIPPDPAGVLTVGPVLVNGDGKAYVYAYTRVLSTLYLVHGL